MSKLAFEVIRRKSAGAPREAEAPSTIIHVQTKDQVFMNERLLVSFHVFRRLAGNSGHETTDR